MTAANQLAREYELIYIMKPSVSPADARKVSERITDIVDKKGAKLTRVDNWGKRKLAYPISKHTRGVFVFVKVVGFNDVVAEIERNLRNLDDVMRWQTVRLETTHDLAAVQVDPDEVKFLDVEVSEEEDEDPSFEERLGMKARVREDRGDRGADDEISDDDSADDSDDDDDVPVVKPRAALVADDDDPEDE
jgi:small subunit ribosomal protein S6